jgi:hypothetical protein
MPVLGPGKTEETRADRVSLWNCALKVKILRNSGNCGDDQSTKACELTLQLLSLCSMAGQLGLHFQNGLLAATIFV